jgi:hypothetical protein
VCQIYVDDIIFGSTNKKSCEEFSKVMMQKFEMSMMGELNYFLGFQVKQIKEGTTCELMFWSLMPKGEKLRPKQLDQLPLVNFSKF